MSIYIHIPFCRSRCIYCDFYSTTQEDKIAAYVEAVCCELRDRRHELGAEDVQTIYFGGGTPSLLSANQLHAVLNCIYKEYSVSGTAEVTVEMNPDDVLRLGLVEGFNRVSLGVQTFDDKLLRFIRRRHDAATAVNAVGQLQAEGCSNISIDLIYGLPNQTLALWERDLDTALSLGVQHLSAYALSYEPGTPLHRMLQEQRVCEADDELSATMYYRLCERASQAGFEHYEISNFALPGFRSRHNSSYWKGAPYLGIGPGAHSYDGLRKRRANTPNLTAYLCGERPAEVEVLSDSELYDEAVMCGLRTCEGIDLTCLSARFGQHRLDYLLRMAQPHIKAQRLTIADNHLRLSHAALMVSDGIMSDLMA
ncbi:MAG: radical SAM family heme chaperone HemW [Bacteroidaceae bacterium]|nr:radical SAM family heme chaperone HemW [Bacteroidaceae bacterium]